MRSGLVAIASFGLEGSSVPPPQGPYEDWRWDEFLYDVRDERLEGLLIRAIVSDSFPATDAQRLEAEQIETQEAVRAICLERELLRTITLLREAGVELRLLKGSAVAHLDYEDPAMRGFGDIDLLIPSEQLDRALAVLIGSGGRRPSPSIHPGFDRRFGKGFTVVTSDGVELDIHRTFVAGPFGLTIDLPGLFTTAELFTLGGQQVPALSRDQRFVHACFHAALGSVQPRLMPLRDVAQMALDPRLDQQRCLDLARAWRAEPVVGRAVTLAWDTFSLHVATELSDWAKSHRPSASEQRAIDSYLRDHHRYGRQAISGLWVIPGLSAKAAYVRALALPDRTHLQARGESTLGRLARGLRLLREKDRA